MAEHTNPAPDPAPKTTTEKIVDAAQAVGGHVHSRLMNNFALGLLALGEDVLYQIYGHPVVDRILGREKIKKAEAHAAEGKFEEAWEVLHGHVNEKRRRFGRADLRAQRRLVTPRQANEFNAWMAGLPAHQRTAVHKYFEAYVDEDLQVTDLAAFIRRTPQQRLDFLASIHEHGLADALRNNHAAVVADNVRLDQEHAASWARINPNRGPRQRPGFFTGLFRLW